MFDWDKLRIFHAVAEAGSLTAAGERLGVTQSALSRQIRSLEEDLATPLFTRHARGLVLTQEGRELYNTAHDVLLRIEGTARSIQEAKGEARGLLRVTSMLTFGSVWLPTYVRRFLEMHPNLNIELCLTDEELDLATGQADVSIRLSRPEQADLIARPLMTFHAHIYASRDYLEKRGTPMTPRDLDYHDLISFNSRGDTPIKGLDWLVRVGSEAKSRVPRLRIDNLYGVLHAVEAGNGIAVLPDYLVGDRPNMVRILPQIEGTHYDAWYCYASELRGSPRVRLFYEFLRGSIATGDR